MWRAIAKRLLGSVIEGGHDCYQFLLGHLGEVSVFRKKLMDQLVRVFVHPSFPGCIRMSKVDPRLEIPDHPDMIIKFRPLSYVIVWTGAS